jgi:REP element-mobilizing transposase RayT
MPNHFHFLIYTSERSCELKKMGSVEMPLLSAKTKTFLSSYTQAINKQEKRTGSLFRQKSKFKFVEDDHRNYPFIAFHYIHQNPLKAGLVERLEEWKFSSFNEYWKRDSCRGLCNIELATDLIDFGDDDFYMQSYSVNAQL